MGILSGALEALEKAVSGLGGHRGQRSMQVTSVMFERDAGWTEARARRWLERQGYKFGKVDITARYLHYRQKDPSGFKVIRTIAFGDETGIKATVGR